MKTIKISIKILFRLLALPFFVGLQVVAFIRILFFSSYCFIRYGGEAIAYTRANTPKMINDIFELLLTKKPEGAK